jgi:hypothetical protein
MRVPMSSFPKLSFVIIHNNDGRRLAHVLPECQRLAQNVGGTMVEVFEQPEIKPHSRMFALARAVSSWALNRQWEKHLGCESYPLMKSFFAHLYGVWWSYYGYGCVTSGRVFRLCRSGAIEMIVARKHITAWRTCNHGADYIIVIEDDAVFLPETELRFLALLDRLNTRSPANDLYVDLAGGWPISALRVANVISKRTESWNHFYRPVTNTACAYLISSVTARRFCRILDERPWFRWAPIDWLINGLFVRAMKNGVVFDCMHADPPILAHGSIEGIYAPWER